MENIVVVDGFQGDRTYDVMWADESVIQASIEGCKDSFLKVINEHKDYLYRTAFLYMKNEHEALEVYQSTVYKAYINIRKLKNPKYFKTWITRILINVANDMYRQRKKDALVYSKQVLDNFNDEIDIEDKIVLYEAIDFLSSNQKTSIILRYIHDMPIKEISIIMNCSENTVKSYIRRAKKELVKILKEVE